MRINESHRGVISPLSHTKITLVVVGSDGKINDTIMQWGKQNVVAITDRTGNVLFKHLFLPGSFMMGTRLAVVAEIDGKEFSQSFPLISNAPVQLVGKPKGIIMPTAPMQLMWYLTYDDELPTGTDVRWYAITSNGLTPEKNNYLRNRTNNVSTASIDDDEANAQDLFNNKCFTMIVKVAPPGGTPETINAIRMSC